MRKQLHGVWVTELRSPDGATAVVADHGAHLLSWTPAAGRPAIYLSGHAHYGTLSAIRGGVPVLFPQFGERGPGQFHGFARRQDWRLAFSGVEHGRALARYRLNDSDAPDNGWAHSFELTYDIALSANDLHMSLTVRNCADHAWEFGAALHTYLQISEIDNVYIRGLQGCDYLDKTAGGATATQEIDFLRVQGEVDSIYLAVKEPVVVEDNERVITVSKQGFDDVVIWNPGAQRAAQLTDMGQDDFRSFVCVEAGAIGNPVLLQQGETWRGAQNITIADKMQ